MKTYTDYPITELGDVKWKEAIFRECKILDYDYDEYYLIIDVQGIEKSVKRVYVYNSDKLPVTDVEIDNIIKQ